MIKIWAKTMKEEKIQRNAVYEFESAITMDSFFTCVSDICAGFDIPTPLILSTHIHSFNEFNIAKFKPSEFVETVDFDFLVLECFS